ncbi:MAG: hypothetical protein Kow0029_24310 [Candidatus Rifleibacteriota bacterium]
MISSSNSNSLAALNLGPAIYNLSGTILSESSKEPIANSNVKLYYEKLLVGQASSTTDGKFFFDNIPSQFYSIVVGENLANFASSTIYVKVKEDGTTSPASLTIYLSSKIAKEGEPAAVKSKITGVALESDGNQRISNLIVSLLKNDLIIKTQITDSNGSFEFADLGVGSYVIEIEKDSQLYYPLSKNVSIFSDGTVSPPTINFALTRKPLENYVLSGFLKTKSGEAISGAIVGLSKSPSDLPFTTTYTTIEGKFFFQSLGSGQYFLKINADPSKYLPYSDALPVNILNDGTVSPEVPIVTLDPVKTNAIINAKVSGTVYDSITKEKLDNIVINLLKNGQIFKTTITQNGGSFEFDQLGTGSYTLEAEKDSKLYEFQSSSFSVTDDGSVLPPIVNFSLTAKTVENFSLKGRLITSDNQPVGNVKIELKKDLQNNPTILTTYSNSEGYYFFSGLDSGLYFISATDFSTDAYKDFDNPIATQILPDGTSSPTIPTIILSVAKPIRNDFKISGFIKDSLSKAGLTGIKVTLRKNSISSSILDTTYTTSEGSFIFDGLASGLYYVEAADGSTKYESNYGVIRIQEAGTYSPETLEILLSEKFPFYTDNVKGVVYDAFTGSPVEFAKGLIGNDIKFVTDSNGAFKYSEATSGVYKLNIEKEGFDSVEITFKVNEDGTTQPSSLSIPVVYKDLEGYGSIAGRLVKVSDASGIENAYVWLYAWNEVTKLLADKTSETGYEITNLVKTTKSLAYNATDYVDRSGTFKFTLIAPGSYYLIVTQTSTPPSIIPTPRTGFTNTWNEPDPTDPNIIMMVKNLQVESGKTTFWTNYEHEK